MNVEVIAEVKMVTGKDKLKGRADVLIPLGTAGLVQLLGCSIIEQPGKGAMVFLPSRKGNKADQYFDSVRLFGPINQLVTDAVLNEYQRLQKAAKK